MKCNHERLDRKAKGKYNTVKCPKCGKSFVKGKYTPDQAFGWSNGFIRNKEVVNKTR